MLGKKVKQHFDGSGSPSQHATRHSQAIVAVELSALLRIMWWCSQAQLAIVNRGVYLFGRLQIWQKFQLQIGDRMAEKLQIDLFWGVIVWSKLLNVDCRFEAKTSIDLHLSTFISSVLSQSSIAFPCMKLPDYFLSYSAFSAG